MAKTSSHTTMTDNVAHNLILKKVHRLIIIYLEKGPKWVNYKSVASMMLFVFRSLPSALQQQSVHQQQHNLNFPNLHLHVKVINYQH